MLKETMEKQIIVIGVEPKTNNVTGQEIAIINDATEMYRVVKKIAKKTAPPMRADGQATASMIPVEVATPFPPLN